MTKSELIDRVKKEADKNTYPAVTKKQVEAVIQAMTVVIQDGCLHGDKVTLPGVGTFNSKHVEARETRNPHTGTTSIKPAHTHATFSFSRLLQDWLLKQTVENQKPLA